MKIRIEGKPTISQYLISIGVFLLIFSSVSQYNRNSGLRQQKKENDVEIKLLKSDNSKLQNDIVLITKYKDSAYKVVDSIIARENYYKNKYYVANQKLKDILKSYNSSSVDDKNRLFTRDLSN